MTRQAVEDGLYDDSYEMYEEPLTRARREILAEMARDNQESEILDLTMMPDQD